MDWLFSIQLLIVSRLRLYVAARLASLRGSLRGEKMGMLKLLSKGGRWRLRWTDGTVPRRAGGSNGVCVERRRILRRGCGEGYSPLGA